MPRNGWLASVGITGWFASECPAGMRRITHEHLSRLLFGKLIEIVSDRDAAGQALLVFRGGGQSR